MYAGQAGRLLSAVDGSVPDVHVRAWNHRGKQGPDKDPCHEKPLSRSRPRASGETYEEHYFGVQLYDYPKYAKIAAAYDMDYFHCDSNETLDAELDRFLACDNACIMVCEVDSHNNTK